MSSSDHELSDRQARAVIIAAERLGFEREPDLYVAWYHRELHDDAREAARYLGRIDPETLRDALVAAEPIPADIAAQHITESAGFSFWHAEIVIAAATERGFNPPPGQPGMLEWMVTSDQARACVTFLWEHHPSHLSEILGDIARIAPLPDSARFPGRDSAFFDL
jgi:hypothetical protein